MAIQYAPLFALETQFQTKDGRNNTGGWLKVFLAATDDPATTYSDYNGTRNPEKIVLDDDGRALVICDKSKAYRLEVYDINGMLLWTEEPVYCSGTGGGGVSITKVISTDGSISVDENVAGSTTTYDLGIAQSSDEFLEWIKCSENDCGATWYPVFQDGSMETEAGKGIKVHGGHLYHFTNSFTVDPDGTGVNYDTFHVAMYCGDAIVDERDFDIDSSLNDPVLCEFSRDVVPSKDTHVYFKLTIPSTCKVSGEVQCHRIYSGINAVPDTCATKQWVSGSYQPLSGMSSYVPYSSVGNNSMGQVTGINGSAIVGGLDSASVSSIASSVASAYTESAFSSLSSKADSSALSAYQPVSAMGAYATTAYVDGRVSGKLDTTAFNSGNFYPTSNPSGYITGVDLSDYATTGYVESAVSGKLDTSAFASASAGFAPAGDYAFNSSLGLYIPVSASGAFQPSGDYAFNSAVSSKLDTSASDFFVMYSSMTSWIPYSALDYSGTAISGIGGSSLAGMGGGGADYTGVYPVNVDNTARTVSVDSLPLVTDSSMTAYGSAGSSVIGVNLDIMSAKQDTLVFSYNTANQISSINGSALGGMDEAAVSGIASAYAQSAASSKLDSTAFNSDDFYSTSNPSGFVDSAYVNSAVSGKLDTSAFNSADFYTTANESGFVDSAYVNSAVSGKLDTSAFNSGDFYSTSNPSGFVGSAYVDSAVSGKLDTSAQVVTSIQTREYQYGGYWITGVKGVNGDILAAHWRDDGEELAAYSDITGVIDTVSSNSATWGQGGIDSATCSSIASSYAESAASSKLDTTAFNSGDFYSTSNPSGFITGVDLTPYQPTSAMSGYIPTSMSSDFQQVAGMSSYALSADVSAAVDLVGTQSANWGGSALQLSAGPGVKLEKSGNVLVASTDETVLWSGNLNTTADKITLSEPFENFAAIDIYWRSYQRYYVNRLQSISRLQIGQVYCDGNYPQITTIFYDGAYSGTEFTFGSMYHQAVTAASNTQSTDFENIGIKKIVGINRTAEA